MNIDLADSVDVGEHVAYGGKLLNALKRSARVAEAKDRQLVIAGSLYLVGDILRLLRDSKEEGRTVT